MSKTKNKKPGKSGKLDSRNPDLSELHRPIDISVSSLKHTAKLLETGTQEIKDILTYEVNLLYECRICGSIFRSIVNLISHKRFFCQDKFNGSTGNKSRDNANSVNITTEDLQRLELDQATLDSLMNPSKNDRILRSQAPVRGNKSDLTSVLQMLQKKQVEKLGETPSQTESPAEKTGCDQVVLQVLDSKRAAYQTLVQPNLSSDDLMENQVIELDKILNQDSAVLRADGQIEKSDSPVHFYGEEDSNKFTCDICSLKFMTQKTYDSHFQIKHAAVRDCYFCPCNSCTAYFSSSMGVKRHLTNFHKKIGQELKALSQQIEKRTLRSKPLPDVVNKKSKKPDNLTQQWIERSDPQALIECVSCGEKFDEKAKLTVHLKNCFRADQERLYNCLCEDDAELEESIMKDTGSEIREIPVHNLSDDNPQTSVSEVTSDGKEGYSIRVEGIKKLSEEEWTKIPTITSKAEEVIAETSSRGLNICPRKTNGPLITKHIVLPTNECLLVPLDPTRKRKLASNEVNRSLQDGKLKKIPCQEYETDKVVKQKMSSQHFSETIASISNQTKLECILCKQTFTNITSLNRHNMESHLKFNRFQCNKCNFKSANRSDCVGHCNKTHNAMNNRLVLNAMISQISHDSTSRGMITVNPSNLNSHSARPSNANSQFGQTNSNTNLLHSRNNSTSIHSELVCQSDTDPESEDRETINRKIDDNPNRHEMIREVIGTSSSGASSSNLNGVNPSPLTNNNAQNINSYNLNFVDRIYNCKFSNTDKDMCPEFDPWNRENNLSRASNDSRRELRSSSRLSKKLDSDDEDDITPELYLASIKKSKAGRRRRRSGSESSRESMPRSTRSNSRMEVRSESRVMTRSQSRQSNRSSRNKSIDDTISVSENETRIQRPKSRAKKDVDKEVPIQPRKRGRPRKIRHSAPEKINDTNLEVRNRRESFSSESSIIQRPVRSRVKHIEKDFIYDLEDDNFVSQTGHSSKKIASSRFNQNGNSNLNLNDSNEDLTILPIVTNHDSSSEVESSELYFRGFPRQPEIFNIE